MEHDMSLNIANKNRKALAPAIWCSIFRNTVWALFRCMHHFLRRCIGIWTVAVVNRSSIHFKSWNNEECTSVVQEMLRVYRSMFNRAISCVYWCILQVQLRQRRWNRGSRILLCLRNNERPQWEIVPHSFGTGEALIFYIDLKRRVKK